MNILDFIRDFPEIKEKDSKYYLYIGIMHGLNARGILNIIGDCLDQGTLKRKILINKMMVSVSKWSLKDNEDLYEKVYNLISFLPTYFKKESAAMILMIVFPYISKNSQNKLAKDLSQSKYKNNRKRIYNYFYKNWSRSCRKIIERAWSDFKDEELIGLIVSHMPKEFLLKNLEMILGYFNEEEFSHDFFRRILRNKFYSRIYEEIPIEIERLKNSDPISYIAIKKERGEELDLDWAIEVYRQFSKSRFLARWYSDMGLWGKISKERPNFLSEIGK